jgi:hypothetical protein
MIPNIKAGETVDIIVTYFQPLAFLDGGGWRMLLASSYGAIRPKGRGSTVRWMTWWAIDVARHVMWCHLTQERRVNVASNVNQARHVIGCPVT